MTAESHHAAHDLLVAELLLAERRLAALVEDEASGDGADSDVAVRAAALLNRCRELRGEVGSWADLEVGLPGALGDLAAAIDALEADVEMAQATEPNAFQVALDRQARRWRAALDRAQLQGALGAMDARDEIDELIIRLDRARGHAVVELHEVGSDSKELLHDLREDMETVLVDVRQAVHKVAGQLLKR